MASTRRVCCWTSTTGLSCHAEVLNTAPATELWLVRHGETEWSRDHRHTSVTDLELTDVGRAQAQSLREPLAGAGFDRVWSSPRRRALQTAELAGFSPEIVGDLVEWDYGDYEGVTTLEIRRTVPDWSVWTHPS